jgi:N-acetylglutamate synthase-like GNAT family acetyltransferase
VTGQNLIRRARRDECALLTTIALRSKASWGYDEQFMADCVTELTISESDIQSHEYFVIESAGGVIGFCALREHGECEGELADVFVEPDHLRAGHGRRLVEQAKSAARARGWHSLLVEADPNARDFYFSCGGTQIGTVASGSIPGRQLPLIKIPL